MKPVYRSDAEPEWKPIKSDLDFVDIDDGPLKISFRFTFKPNAKNYWFAYCYPYSFDESQKMINAFERKFALDDKIYFHKELLTRTREGRPMEMITISSRTHMTKNFEPRFNKLLFPDKK